MFSLFQKKTDKTIDQSKKPSLISKLGQRLKRTHQTLTSSLTSLVLGKKTIDDELLEAIETSLLTADVGIEVCQHVIDALTEKVSRKELSDPQALESTIKSLLLDILEPCTAPLIIDQTKCPFVICMVGVNGAGKTTTIGKLAKQCQQQSKSVTLAAGDTFRAAAVEQLQTWGERNDIKVIAQGQGADSASVIYDAMQSAKSRNVDVLITDTAGRLHTQTNLMEELKKIHRVMKKIDEEAPHETLLVLDATTGQNALVQATQFHQAVNVTGIVITKLDGTAKGGIIFAIAKKLGLPIRYIGVGEAIDDLQPFDAKQFVDALFETEAIKES